MLLFAENPIERAAGLRCSMRPVCRDYTFCFSDCLLSQESERLAAVASCFRRLMRDHAENRAEPNCSRLPEAQGRGVRGRLTSGHLRCRSRHLSIIHRDPGRGRGAAVNAATPRRSPKRFTEVPGGRHAPLEEDRDSLSPGVRSPPR
jgi:hypothetical protein